MSQNETVDAIHALISEGAENFLSGWLSILRFRKEVSKVAIESLSRHKKSLGDAMGIDFVDGIKDVFEPDFQKGSSSGDEWCWITARLYHPSPVGWYCFLGLLWRGSAPASIVFGHHVDVRFKLKLDTKLRGLPNHIDLGDSSETAFNFPFESSVSLEDQFQNALIHVETIWRNLGRFSHIS